MTTLMPIGGKISEKNPAVLREFVRRAGAGNADIVILPQASALDDTGEYYSNLFKELGARFTRSLDFRTRAEAFAENFVEALRAASGIFIAGGAQMRLTALLGGTPLEAALRESFERGVIVAGTSAGAAVMSKMMIAYGKRGPTPRDKIAHFAPGFGLTERFFVDQHFRQRDRLGRLIYVIAMNPAYTGLGVDEDTAAIIENDVFITVYGSGAVTIADGSDMQATDVAEIENGGPIAVSKIRIDVLTDGSTYDVRAREAHIPKKVLLNE